MDKTIQNQSKSKRKLIFSFFQFNYSWNSNLVKILPQKKNSENKTKQNDLYETAACLLKYQHKNISRYN